MARVAKNLKELSKLIESNLKDAMEKEVASAVKGIQKNKVKEEVFSVYEPKVYERRTSGGIDDIRNMKHKVEAKGNKVSLTVTNETTGKDDPDFYIAGLIEYGDQNGYGEYDYNYNPYAAYLRPRPFIEETRITLEEQEIAKKSLEKGLKRNGIKVK